MVFDLAGISGGGHRFVGIGIRHYQDPALSELPRAVVDAQQIVARLGDGFATVVVADPTEQQAREALRELDAAMPDGGVLLVLWSGHGITSPAKGVKLLCADNRPSPASGLSPGDVVEPCATSGA